jgi:hypothetical protein
MNNAKIIASNVDTTLTNCVFFFESSEDSNKVKALKDGKTLLAFSLSETKKKIDFYLSLPEGIECEHHKEGIKTSSIISFQNDHLTYHGNAINKKHKQQKGEIHIKHSKKRVLNDTANMLEAPLATSSDISFYPLPLCRAELADSIRFLGDKDIANYFSLDLGCGFFNTLDIFLAKKGFMKNMLTQPYIFPRALLSYFSFVSLEGFFKGNTIIRRTGIYPQILVLQSKSFEVIIFCMREDRNQTYDNSSLKYAYSYDYIKEHFQRHMVEAEHSFFFGKYRDKNIKRSVKNSVPT